MGYVQSCIYNSIIGIVIENNIAIYIKRAFKKIPELNRKKKIQWQSNIVYII